jgi:hypothetical protein
MTNDDVNVVLAMIEDKIHKVRSVLDVAALTKVLYRTTQGMKDPTRRVLLSLITIFRTVDERLEHIERIIKMFKLDQERVRRRAEAIEYDRQDHKRLMGVKLNDSNKRQSVNQRK